MKSNTKFKKKIETCEDCPKEERCPANAEPTLCPIIMGF